MFSKEIYKERRNRLKKLVGEGLIILPGNNESPSNYPNNTYYPFRQDSTFSYFFGLERDHLVGVIDIDADREILLGDDVDIEDIVWLGKVDTMKGMASDSGVAETMPMGKLMDIVTTAQMSGQTIHFLPPYRHDTQIMLYDLLGIHPSQQREKASLPLIKAVVKMRSTKDALEIAELEDAAKIGYAMHTTAMKMTRAGLSERYVGGIVSSVALSQGTMVSFPTIYTQHGEIMHGIPTDAILEDGRLVLCDCGGENKHHYCSDNTRTMPVSGKFTTRQREIYDIVADCHDYALNVAAPGVKYADVHFAICRLMTDRLKELGLMKGDTDEAVRAGAHALFLPHGLGHMMGMDVHDMEGLGQIYVGFDEETRPNLEQFGTNCLRMGRRLEEGFVVTDEPGIYFIPALIDDWKARKHCEEFLCFDKIETYKDFGGIRIEDDILITKDGCRFIGEDRIPYKAEDVEAYMAANR